MQSAGSWHISVTRKGGKRQCPSMLCFLLRVTPVNGVPTAHRLVAGRVAGEPTDLANPISRASAHTSFSIREEEQGALAFDFLKLVSEFSKIVYQGLHPVHTRSSPIKFNGACFRIDMHKFALPEREKGHTIQTRESRHLKSDFKP